MDMQTSLFFSIPFYLTNEVKTRALLRLERTMNLLEGRKRGRVGERGWEGTEGGWGRGWGGDVGGEREGGGEKEGGGEREGGEGGRGGR